MMRPEQIELSKNALRSLGINLDDYVLDITVNLFETVMLKFVHKNQNISITVDDPTNYPYQFEVKFEGASHGAR